MSDLTDLPPLREVIAAHGLRAEKSLGQNFLLDLNITDKIARAAGNLTGCTVIEIGPGPGGLTRSLLKTGADRILAIEFDQRAVLALRQLEEAAGGRLDVIHADALKSSPLDLSPQGPRAIVANLPYNIGTPLLIGWLAELHRDQSAYRSLTLLFQREVAERICASPGSKTYGRLSVIAQWLCETRRCFDISGQAFTPAPKVTSTLVHLIPIIPSTKRPDFATVEKLTAMAFGQRRKMLRSSLKAYNQYFGEAGIDPELRAENLEVSKFIKLASLIPPA